MLLLGPGPTVREPTRCPWSSTSPGDSCWCTSAHGDRCSQAPDELGSVQKVMFLHAADLQHPPCVHIFSLVPGFFQNHSRDNSKSGANLSRRQQWRRGKRTLQCQGCFPEHRQSQHPGCPVWPQQRKGNVPKSVPCSLQNSLVECTGTAIQQTELRRLYACSAPIGVMVGAASNSDALQHNSDLTSRLS